MENARFLPRIGHPFRVNHSEEFLLRYGNAWFPHAEQLLPLLRSDSAKVERHGELLPCSHYESIYRVRTRIVARSGKPDAFELSAQCAAFADTLAESPDEPGRLWLFRVRGYIFSVFEMTTSQRIAGCFHFPDDYGTTQPEDPTNSGRQ
jgi:hypothetical protein